MVPFCWLTSRGRELRDMGKEDSHARFQRGCVHFRTNANVCRFSRLVYLWITTSNLGGIPELLSFLPGILRRGMSTLHSPSPSFMNAAIHPANILKLLCARTILGCFFSFPFLPFILNWMSNFYLLFFPPLIWKLHVLLLSFSGFPRIVPDILKLLKFKISQNIEPPSSNTISLQSWIPFAPLLTLVIVLYF